MRRFELLTSTPKRVKIRYAIGEINGEFDDCYRAGLDRTHSFRFDISEAVADGGWLGIAKPVEFGGAEIGIAETAMQEIGRSAGALAEIILNAIGHHDRHRQ